MAVTHVDQLPSWDQSKLALINPLYWEKWWYVTYELCGPVANQAKDFMKKLQKVQKRKEKDLEAKA